AFGDAIHHCSSRRILRAASWAHSNSTGSVRQYVFASPLEEPAWAPLDAFHGLDLPFWLGNFGTLPVSAAERALGDSMRRTLVTLVVDGVPPSDVSWPPFVSSDEAYLHLVHDGPAPRSRYRQAACDFWDSLEDVP
ncbi:MAG: carboxylesterase family protein, partial [Myxococcota bacterium]